MSDLRRELRAVGIRGRALRRILAETSAHDPAELGDPRALAAEFADALAPKLARRSAFASFSALAVAGTISLAAFATLEPRSEPAADVPLLLMAVVMGQVAFVAGALGLLRALRRPQDVRTVARRALVGVLAGAATLVSLTVIAHPNWELALSAPALLALAATAPIVARGLSLRTLSTAHGDLTDDLPVAFDARAVAAGAGVLVLLASVAASDPFDGLIRGVFEGLACYGGFLVLGRFLGLRR